MAVVLIFWRNFYQRGKFLTMRLGEICFYLSRLLLPHQKRLPYHLSKHWIKIWRINRTLSIDSPSKNIFYPILTNEIRWGASLEEIWSLQPECRTGEVAALIVITPPQVTQETPQVELLQMLNSRLNGCHMSDLQNLIEL